MRTAIIILPLLALGACQVSKDEKNDSTTVQYNQDMAANAASDATNHAGNIAGHIVNDVQDAGNSVQNGIASAQNGVANADVDVDLNTNN